MITHEMFPLSTILYYRIGGTARYLLEAQRADDVLEALDFVRASGLERLVIVGSGSNLLFPDGLFDGAVVRLASGDSSRITDMGGGRLRSFGGEDLDSVIRFGFQAGYRGLEWAGGLPGTVGAAVRGNVGAFGGELRNVLESAEVIDYSSVEPQLRTLSNRDLCFAYRESLVKRAGKMVVVSATFALRPASADDIADAERAYRSHIEYRQRNHPMEYPTCGSVFKNVKRSEEVARVLEVWPDAQELVATRWHGKVSMGYIIDRLGLRGLRVGGAQISLKHNNFIVNLGDARFSDVLALIETVEERFERTFGFLPEPEVEIVGQDRR